jgi:hypothetical protein
VEIQIQIQILSKKNKKIQIRVKILPKNVFENTKTKTFQLLLVYMDFFIYYIVN